MSLSETYKQAADQLEQALLTINRSDCDLSSIPLLDADYWNQLQNDFDQERARMYPNCYAFATNVAPFK